MGKFAVLSDIHSNVWALEAVLLDAKQKDVDALINLGDILYGPLAPRRTYDLLQTEEIITIKGNQDRQIYQASDSQISANPTMQYILSDLGNDPLQWMKKLPAIMSFDKDIFLCHGTPDDDLIYMLEDVSEGCAKMRPDSEILNFAAGVQEKIILCGHSHIPRTVQLSSGTTIVNPGSVGLPAYCDHEPVPHKMENYSNLAQYCIVESMSSGWQIEHIRVPYNHNCAIQAAKKRNRMDWAQALESGRVAT